MHTSLSKMFPHSPKKGRPRVMQVDAGGEAAGFYGWARSALPARGREEKACRAKKRTGCSLSTKKKKTSILPIASERDCRLSQRQERSARGPSS